MIFGSTALFTYLKITINWKSVHCSKCGCMFQLHIMEERNVLINKTIVKYSCASGTYHIYITYSTSKRN